MEQVIKKRLQQVMDASVAKGETPGCLLMVIKDGEEQVYLESGYAAGEELVALIDHLCDRASAVGQVDVAFRRYADLLFFS